MKKYLLLILLLLIACGPKEEETPITDKDYREGTDGLVFEFHPNAPPVNIFETSGFEVATDVWNKGAYTATQAYLTIILENEYMCVPQGEGCVVQKGSFNPLLTQNLLKDGGEYSGRSISTPDGTSRFAKYNVDAQKLDLLSVQHTSPVILTACYAYTTEHAQDICIDPDPTSTIDKVCEVSEISLTDQGAPIAITKIETRILPDGDQSRPQFLIHIKNKGDGEVVNVSKLQEACSSQKMDHKDWNRVYLTGFWFSNEMQFYKRGDSNSNIECTPNPLRLTSGEGYIKCSVKNTIPRSDAPYTTQAYIRLDYGYTHSESKDVLIESVE